MKNQINLDDIKNLIKNFALHQGLSEKFINLNWSLDYQINIEEDFQKTFSNLHQAMKLFKLATEKNDLITAQCGLVHAIVRTGQLRDFFAALDNDLKHILIDFESPDIPDNYKIPAHYSYEN